MPKTAIKTTTIEKFSHDGRGIARIDGKTTFIQGALPGETVVFEYTKVKRDYDEGRVLSIVSQSSYRVKPRCSHYEICGGCSLQHLNEQAQIHVKQSLLLDSLQRIGHVYPEQILEPLTTEHSWNYRSKARLSVRYIEKKQATLVGFREKNNPRYITEIKECPILISKVDAQIVNLRQLMDSLDAKNSIAQIEVAAGDDVVALIFRHIAALTVNDKEKLRQFGQATGFALFLQPGNADSISLFYPQVKPDVLQYVLPVDNIAFTFHPTDFIQVNRELNRKMVAYAILLMNVNKDDVVLDLFCGLGNFSLSLAQRCKQVIGVEGSETMVLRAKKNALANNIENAQFYCVNLQHLDAIAKIAHHHITKVLLDPPRTGALEIIRQIDTLNPVRLVYVSCNPATLARDSDLLVNQHGYRLKAAGVMDMFPHTAHVESIALFEKE